MKSITSKLLLFQQKVNTIKKDGKNPHFKSTYATLTQILGEVKPVLSECGLVLLQLINEHGIGTSIICPETGEQIDTFIPMPANLNAQQLGSAITYYRRYTLASLLALEIDDDDANLATNAKPLITSEQLDKAKLALTSKSVTIEQIKNKYKLTKEQENFLCQI